MHGPIDLVSQRSSTELFGGNARGLSIARADVLLAERANALAAVGGLTKEDALKKLYEELERENAEDLMMRTAKLERDGLRVCFRLTFEEFV